MIDIKTSVPKTLLNRTLYRRRMKKAVKEATIFCHDRARFLSPFKTGKLRKSIQREIKGLAGRVFTTLFYAVFLEFGTRFIKPFPFMRPAAAAAQEYFKNRVQRGIEKSL